MNAQTKIETPANVYAKIAAVQGELAKVGIAKSRRNSQQGYDFRGIDEVYAALSPLLSTHGLIILPRITKREVVERQTAKGGALFNVTVWAEFDFISADDGSIHTAATFGEAMDSADKATNKAMSAAYKYAAFMAFAIPTEGDNDADATTHEVAARSARDGGDVRPHAASSSATTPNEMPDAEWSRLIALVEATGVKLGGLLKKYQVHNLRLLNQDQYADAIEGLTGMLAKKAKEESDAKAKAAAPINFSEILKDEVPF